jgi:tRNA modification GTPase
MRPSATDSGSPRGDHTIQRDQDTICALATAHGLGAISVIRLSGKRAIEVARKTATFLPENLESHKIYYGVLKDAAGAALDEVLVSYFAQGRSFTGEASFEISCHGSEAIVNEILQALVSFGARPSERGEFTYRSFMNGRMDLVQAESVLAMIESRSKRASNLAFRQLRGDLSTKLRALTERLTWILAQLEANIDFAAEDIEIAADALLAGKAKSLLEDVEALLATYRQGRLIRNGFQVVIAGRPNAGKSSLLNALAGEDRAIVTPIAGTTRDFVEAETQIDGHRVSIVDCAGLRVTDDPIEKIGVARALEKLKEADLVLYLVDAAEGLTQEDTAFFSAVPWDKTVVVENKEDLVAASSRDQAAKIVDAIDAATPKTCPGTSFRSDRVIRTSALRGTGLDQIRNLIGEDVRGATSEDSTLLSSARHFQGLEKVRASLKEAIPMLEHGESADLIALELQAGLQALYEILGLTYDDQVMDRVFNEFCLGK